MVINLSVFSKSLRNPTILRTMGGCCWVRDFHTLTFPEFVRYDLEPECVSSQDVRAEPRPTPPHRIFIPRF